MEKINAQVTNMKGRLIIIFILDCFSRFSDLLSFCDLVEIQRRYGISKLDYKVRYAFGQCLLE